MGPTLSRKRKLLLATGAVMLTLMLLEAGMRIHDRARFGTPLFGKQPNPYVVRDSEAGWLPRPSANVTRQARDLSGRRYEVHYSTDKHGFRTSPKAEDRRPAVLFIGDSFTQAIEVSDDETYHAIVQRELPVAVHAMGALGYGTLQEFYLLDDWLDTIKPEVVVLQVCSNDFINNHEALEAQSRRNNHGRRRPYLMPDGTIEVRKPRDPLIGPLVPLADHSRLGAWVLTRLGRMRAAYSPLSVEDLIMAQGETHPGFQESVEITRALLKKLKDRCGDTPLMIMAVGEIPPFAGAFKKLCDEVGIIHVGGIAAAHREAEKQHKTVRSGDRAHWNELGHQLAAEVVVKALSKQMKLDTNLVRKASADHDRALNP